MSLEKWRQTVNELEPTVKPNCQPVILSFIEKLPVGQLVVQWNRLWQRYLGGNTGQAFVPVDLARCLGENEWGGSDLVPRVFHSSSWSVCLVPVTVLGDEGAQTSKPGFLPWWSLQFSVKGRWLNSATAVQCEPFAVCSSCFGNTEGDGVCRCSWSERTNQSRQQGNGTQRAVL